jgi:acetyl esterase/lipase
MTDAAWRRRFRAPRPLMPQWARDRPERAVYVSNHGGKWEVYAWDLEADAHRQVTDRREGTVVGQISPDGEEIWWFDDTEGDELGVWTIEPFGGGERRTLEVVPRGYGGGLAIGTGGWVAAISEDDTHRIYAAHAGEAPWLVYEHREAAWLSGQSREWQPLGDLPRDERLFCFHHSEHGDSRHPAVRVCTMGGESVAELWDGPGMGLFAAGWSPVAGDNRIVVHHERSGSRRPLLWTPETGEAEELDLDLGGEVEAAWYPGGDALLLRHDHRGRAELLRLDLATRALERLDVPAGMPGPAAVRPDGSVWYAWSSASEAPQIRSTAGDVVLRLPGEGAPKGVAYTDLPVGEIHAFVAEPSGPRPHPTVFLIHGGPDSHDGDQFQPAVQAWVDHGFAVVLVNYRGSTGYGQKWRDAITGNPGFTELEDIGAVRERVLAEGIADPECLILAGGSWGGFLTLLGLGTQPDGWSLGLAAVPIGDYIAAYEDEMDPLKAYDRALFGASPAEDPERYRLRSPITHVDRVTAPVFILAGENDPRCPIRGIDGYLERLRELGKEHEVLRFDAGHGSMQTDERIRHLEAQIAFVSRQLGTPPPL